MDPMTAPIEPIEPGDADRTAPIPKGMFGRAAYSQAVITYLAPVLIFVLLSIVAEFTDLEYADVLAKVGTLSSLIFGGGKVWNSVYSQKTYDRHTALREQAAAAKIESATATAAEQARQLAESEITAYLEAAAQTAAQDWEAMVELGALGEAPPSVGV